MAQTIRMAYQADAKEFGEYIRELTSGIDAFEKDRTQRYNEAWEALKAMKRG